MDFRFLEKYQPQLLAALRIVVGLLFFEHATQKFFAFPVPFPLPGPLPPLLIAAGAIELVAGALVTLGLFTRLAAFIASGEMAVAYFWIHSAGSGSIWWWQNHGELVMLFCFIWLAFAAWGGGPFSVDAARARGASGRV